MCIAAEQYKISQNTCVGNDVTNKAGERKHDRLSAVYGENPHALLRIRRRILCWYEAEKMNCCECGHAVEDHQTAIEKYLKYESCHWKKCTCLKFSLVK